MNRPLFAIDTRDDRVEIWHLLHRLPPRARLSFLRWCCRRVADPRTGNGPKPAFRRDDIRQAYRCERASERLTNAVYSDILSLIGQHGLDPAAATLELERWGKAGGVPADIHTRELQTGAYIPRFQLKIA